MGISDRFKGFTIGDPEIYLYDISFEQQIVDSGKDVPEMVEALGAELGHISFPFPVDAVRG